MAIVLPVLTCYHRKYEVGAEIEEAQPVHSTVTPALESRLEGILRQLAFRSVLTLSGNGDAVANRTKYSTTARLARLCSVMAYNVGEFLSGAVL